MDNFINELVDEHLAAFMNKSKERFALADAIYQNDRKDADRLEMRYQALELAEKERLVINDYIACLQTTEGRATDLAYMAGVADTVKILHQLNVIQCIEG